MGGGQWKTALIAFMGLENFPWRLDLCFHVKGDSIGVFVKCSAVWGRSTNQKTLDWSSFNLVCAVNRVCKQGLLMELAGWRIAFKRLPRKLVLNHSKHGPLIREARVRFSPEAGHLGQVFRGFPSPSRWIPGWYLYKSATPYTFLLPILCLHLAINLSLPCSPHDREQPRRSAATKNPPLQ